MTFHKPTRCAWCGGKVRELRVNWRGDVFCGQAHLDRWTRAMDREAELYLINLEKEQKGTDR